MGRAANSSDTACIRHPGAAVLAPGNCLRGSTPPQGRQAGPTLKARNWLFEPPPRVPMLSVKRRKDARFFFCIFFSVGGKGGPR
jgi:hypothetical protein